MNDFQSVVYKASVIEFVTVAKEFCTFLGTSSHIERVEFVGKLQKFIPLLYLKGAMLPEVSGVGDGVVEDTVTEEEYNTLFSLVKAKLGEYDEYLEVFDDAEGYRDEPTIHTISEKLADIYQDLKNFLHAYRSGVPMVMEDALWTLKNNFDLFWGKACAEVLKAVHQTASKLSGAAESEDNNRIDDSIDSMFSMEVFESSDIDD